MHFIVIWRALILILASVNHLRFVRGAKELLSASEDTDAHLWDIETTEIIQTYGKGFKLIGWPIRFQSNILFCILIKT